MGASDLTLIVGGDDFREDVSQKQLSRHLRLLLRSGVVIGADTGAWLMATRLAERAPRHHSLATTWRIC